MHTLLNFSGGVDSTHCLYHYLLSNKKDLKDKLLVHHLHLKNHEGRADYELKAVQNILKWMRDHNLKNFKYIQSSFDYGTIKHIISDAEIMGFLTGVIMRGSKFRSVTNIILPMHKTEMDRLGENSYYKGHERRKQLIELVAKREAKFDFPILEKSKKKIISELPNDLFKLTWYCRKPTSDGRSCGNCHTCKAVKGDSLR